MTEEATHYEWEQGTKQNTPGVGRLFDEALERMGGELDRLESLLSAALREAGPEKLSGVDVVPSSSLMGQVTRLQSMAGRLAVINSRIDL